MNRRQAIAWGIFTLTIFVIAALVVLQFLAGDEATSLYFGIVYTVAIFASTGCGLLLAIRCPDNPLGLLLLVNGLVFAGEGFVDNYAVYTLFADGSLPGGRLAAAISDGTWPALFACPIAIAYLFPDGHLPSPRWRPIARIGVASFAVLSLVLPFKPEALDPPYDKIVSPFPALPGAIASPLSLIGLFGTLAALIGGALAIRARFKKADGLERQQMKLLAYAAAAIPGTMIACLVQSALTGSNDISASIGLGLFSMAVPVAVAVAVLRYRLYDLDRIVNRTLVYALLTTALAAIYAAVSLGLGLSLGSGSTIPTAAATLAAAVAFGILRSRIQSLVDRRFNPARYEGLRSIEVFLTDLRAGRAPPEQTGAALAEALHDPSLELFFRIGSGEDLVDSSGRPAQIPADDARARTPVHRGGLPLGTILHDPALGKRPDTLASVIAASGLAIEIARLRVEVSRRLDEVSESRARIVAVGYEERRRLERDLHDGAQQRLVSIGLNLRHLQGQLAPGEDELREGLDETVGELTNAINELRELARGVRPALLDDGLAPALRELASRSSVPASVEEATEERFGEPVEAAAYFVASEALANSAKHADAKVIRLKAVRQNGSLVLSVADDGVGGAVAAERSGLAGITDRIAALGGSLAIDSPPGGGTTITAELPCA